MNNHIRIHILLAAGVLLCLLQVWLPGWFLTGDGPCHVENARILHDLWSNKNASFYSRFYDIIYQPNPNWFATLVISGLMYVVNGVVAEKIFLSFYVLFFCGGFYLLLKKLCGGNSWWMVSVFVFVFTHALFKGFYNFTFSIAFYFWVVWAWLRFLDKRNVGNAVLFIFLTGFIFFTHLLSFVFAVFTCGALVVSYALIQEKKKRLSFFFATTTLLLLFVAPFAGIMRWFTEKEGGMQISLHHHFSRLKELIVFRYAAGLSHKEVVFAAVAGVLLMLLFGIVFFKGLRQFKWNKYDGFIAGLLLVTFVYLFFPEEFMGRVILISLRVQPMVLIMTACIIAYRMPEGLVKTASGLILFACFAALTFVRTSRLMVATRAIKEVSLAEANIRPYSVVLPLDFAPGGKDEHGQVIADRNWIFSHASQYMGLEKPLIILDNYEANTGYFPLVWKPDVNPYYFLGKNGSFENLPPAADLADYKSKTGVTIDYVLIWCFDSSALKNEAFAKLYKQIGSGYNRMYISPGGRVILFKKMNDM